MSKVLVTGGTGFVGRFLIDSLVDQKYAVTALVRKPSLLLPEEVGQVVTGDLSEWSDQTFLFKNELEKALEGIDVVIHLAARVHIMKDKSDDPLTSFRRANRDATVMLAKLAAQSDVKRFIFISSIKVNGELTQLNQPFKPSDSCVSDDPYALSKYEAEQRLLELARDTRLEFVIIRPPLIYGPGVGANFARLLKWIDKGLPLPLGSIHNQRSLLALDNLVDFIVHCISHPKAANEVFLVSDGEDVSTTQLMRGISNAFAKKSRLLPIPVGLMSFLAKLIGKKDIADRLFGSLQLDSSKARDLLAWQPVVTMDAQLKKTVDEYLINEKTF